MLLRDYAITPDVFDVTSYTSEEVCGLHLDRIREVMLGEGLVRDLRSGEWRALFAGDLRTWHRRGKELVKKLATQGRLVEFPPSAADPPGDDPGWCAEALATHRANPLAGGIVVTEGVKAAYPAEPIVASIDKLSSTPWWTGRSPSVRLSRTLAAYQDHLGHVLRCANSIQFIDPYVDPSQGGYRTFGNLLALAGNRDPAPVIEVHRVCWEESRDKRLVPEFQNRIQQSFVEHLGPVMRRTDLQVEIFLWDDFHDRHVISNLIGVSAQNGFDTTRARGSLTTWTRMGRVERDDVQREFDPASNRHALRHRFRVQ